MNYIRTVLLPFALTLFLLISPFNGEAGELEGDYKLLDGLLKVKEKKDFKKPEVLEFFNFGCSHCYDFLKKGLEEKLIKKFEGKIEYKDIPIFWGSQTHYPGLLYDWVKGNRGHNFEMKKAIFTSYFEDRANIFDKRIASMLTDDFNIGNKLYSAGDKPENIKVIKEDLKLAEKLNVHETPTIIINRSIVVLPSMSGKTIEDFEANLEKVISSLLEKYYTK